MREYVSETLVERARKGEICIISARGSKKWDLKNHDSILIYEGPQSRGASLSTDKAFELIMKFLVK